MPPLPAPRPLRTPLVIALLAAAVIACGGAPSASPAASTSASAGPSQSVAGHVTGPADAFAAVQARSPWFDGVKPRDAQAIGQAAWWEATRAPDGTWRVTVEVGWGDCPAGCINRHTWHWSVAADGTVALLDESGPGIPADVQASLAAAATASGVGGQVTAGPTCPVERPGDSACDARTVKGAVLVLRDAGGAEVARFTTDASGLFRIALAPGSYTLEPQPVEGLMGTARPQQVTVEDGKLTTLAVTYDTGIR